MERWAINYNIVLSLLLLLSAITLIINDSIVQGQSDESFSEQASPEQMNGENMGGNLNSSVTEWIGVFALGIITGLLAFNIKTSNNIKVFEKRRKIIYQ
jgi:hypothetical protein